MQPQYPQPQYPNLSKRELHIAVAQLGPVTVADSRADVVHRLLRLLREAHRRGAGFVVFPELAFTTFFPRQFYTEQADIDVYFERFMPGPQTTELFATAQSLGIGFSIGFAELDQSDGELHRFNTSILVNPRGEIVGKYRKIHLPGHTEHEPWRAFQHLEKRYFEAGDLGFGVWSFMGARVGMCICNDRRWPETWRVLGLQGAELVTLGYNTPTHYPPVPQHDHLQSFHHLLPMQAGAYQNGCYVAAAAKAGVEEGSELLGHSCIIAPTGELIAQTHTSEDELISAECDFSRCAEIKQHIFNFALHRRPLDYSLITQQPPEAIQAPPLLNADLPYLHQVNQFKEPDASEGQLLSAQGCQQAREAISQWPGYAITPLRLLPELARCIGVRQIFYKDEAPRFGLGSFKALGGAYAVSVILCDYLTEMLGRAVTIEELTSAEHREITRDVVVSCATDGNHGRSVAWGAQRFGCGCVIYIHSEVSAGRKSAIEAYGAEVIRVDGNYDDSVRIAATEADAHNRIVVSDTSYPGYLDIPADVMRGYTVLADEALDQLEGELPTHVFLQGGVGGFAAAVAQRIRARCEAAQPRIIVVEPDQAACIYASIKQGEPVAVHGDLATVMAGLACGEVSLIAFDILINTVDDVLVIPDAAAISTMRLLADATCGDAPLVSGESGVSGLAGLVFAQSNPPLSAALGLNLDSRVLVIGTEGATDPLVYRELVGRSAEVVMQSNSAHD